jgi:hypothetical protein
MWYVVVPEGTLFMELAKVEDKLFVELAKVEDDWLWRNDRIGNMPELGFDCCGRLAGKAKGRMESIGCGAVANASCNLLLEMMIAAKAGLSLAPSFF